MEKNAKIYVAGHRGLVGSAIKRCLETAGYTQIIGRTHAELDLSSQSAVTDFFNKAKPEYVFLAAAKVGGIMANNTRRAEFIYENLMIQSNVIHQSYLSGVKKLMFLGSSCVYPKLAPQPIKEEYLLTSALEYTNEPYAVAKIAGIKMCESYQKQYGANFISVMPTNLYGPGDNYDLQNSHVLPALLRKFHEAKQNNSPEVEIWGDGTPLREFLHTDDLARASVMLMNDYQGTGMINIGTGKDISILELVNMIKSVTEYTGKIRFNKDKPNGTPRKLLDISRLTALGWRPQIELEDGIRRVYKEKFLSGGN